MFRYELSKDYGSSHVSLLSTLQVGFRLAAYNIAEGFPLYFHSNVNPHLLVTSIHPPQLIPSIQASAERFFFLFKFLDHYLHLYYIPAREFLSVVLTQTLTKCKFMSVMNYAPTRIYSFMIRKKRLVTIVIGDTLKLSNSRGHEAPSFISRLRGRAGVTISYAPILRGNVPLEARFRSQGWS